MTTPAIVLGIVVVFGIGYVATRNIGNKLEKRKRGKGISFPPPDPSGLDINTNSIIGGTVVVGLVFIPVLMAPKEMQAVLFYRVIGVGVFLDILTFVWFKSESNVSAVVETPHEQLSGQNEKLLHANSYDYEKQLLIRTALYENLLVKCRRDGGVADRLIEYERKRKPNANELELIENAIERWEKDNRSWRG